MLWMKTSKPMTFTPGGNITDFINKRTRWFLLLLVVFFLSISKSFADDEDLSTSPYDVKILVFSENRELFHEGNREDFSATVVNRCQILAGKLWNVAFEFSDSALPENFSGISIDPQTPPQAPPENWESFDKVFLVSIDSDLKELHAREFDVKTRWMGRQMPFEIAQAEKIVDVLVDALFDLFSPSARVEKATRLLAFLRLRGTAIYSPMVSLSKDPGQKTTGYAGISVPDGVLLPFVRMLDRDGRPLSASPILWTALLTERYDPQGRLLQCGIESGLRDALAARRRGRTEILALSVPTPMSETTLKLEPRVSSGSALKTLPTYEVLEILHGEETPRLIGQTDSHGRFSLTPIADRPIRTILIKSGQAVIARVPIVRGLHETCTIPIPDDAIRLEAEGVLLGIQEEFIDTRTRREILKKRAEKLAQADQDRSLQDPRKELMRLKEDDRFLIDLSQARQRYRSEDPIVQRRIERMFNDTEKIIRGEH